MMFTDLYVRVWKSGDFHLRKICFMIAILLRLMMLRGASSAAAAAALHTPIGCIGIPAYSFACRWQLGFDKVASILQVELPQQRVCSCFFELNAASLHRAPLFRVAAFWPLECTAAAWL